MYTIEQSHEVRRQSAIDRVEARLVYEDGHWIWPGGLRRGRGKLSYRDASGKVCDISTHRVMYERHVGPIPDGYEVHHTCYEPRCCRPSHLEIKTGPENREDFRALLKEAAALRRAELMALP